LAYSYIFFECEGAIRSPKYSRIRKRLYVVILQLILQDNVYLFISTSSRSTSDASTSLEIIYFGSKQWFSGFHTCKRRLYAVQNTFLFVQIIRFQSFGEVKFNWYNAKVRRLLRLLEQFYVHHNNNEHSLHVNIFVLSYQIFVNLIDLQNATRKKIYLINKKSIFFGDRQSSTIVFPSILCSSFNSSTLSSFTIIWSIYAHLTHYMEYDVQYLAHLFHFSTSS